MLESAFVELHGAAVIAVLPLAFSACLRAAPAADAWPQFRGNPQLTGVAAGRPARHAQAALDLRSRRVHRILRRHRRRRRLRRVAIGDLLAVDLDTGKLRWKYHAQDGIGESSPAVHDGVVFVGDLAGMLHAVNAADGKSAVDVQDRRRDQVVAGGRRATGC